MQSTQRKWTQEEDELILKNLDTSNPSEIASLLNRTKSALNTRMAKILKKLVASRSPEVAERFATSPIKTMYKTVARIAESDVTTIKK